MIVKDIIRLTKRLTARLVPVLHSSLMEYFLASLAVKYAAIRQMTAKIKLGRRSTKEFNQP